MFPILFQDMEGLVTIDDKVDQDLNHFLARHVSRNESYWVGARYRDSSRKFHWILDDSEVNFKFNVKHFQINNILHPFTRKIENVVLQPMILRKKLLMRLLEIFTK